jgi:hypothetical protein
LLSFDINRNEGFAKVRPMEPLKSIASFSTSSILASLEGFSGSKVGLVTISGTYFDPRYVI